MDTYKVCVKNLQNNRWDVECNENNTFGELKKKIKSKVIVKNNSYLDDNFPFCIIYHGVRISEKYEDNVTLKELNILKNTILYIVDLDNKKPFALTSSTHITGLKENKNGSGSGSVSVPYSDGMIPRRAPNLSPSFLDLSNLRISNSSSRSRVSSDASNRDYILSKLNPPQLNLSQISNNEISLDESQELILSAIQKIPEYSNSNSNSKSQLQLQQSQQQTNLNILSMMEKIHNDNTVSKIKTEIKDDYVREISEQVKNVFNDKILQHYKDLLQEKKIKIKEKEKVIQEIINKKEKVIQDIINKKDIVIQDIINKKDIVIQEIINKKDSIIEEKNKIIIEKNQIISNKNIVINSNNSTIQILKQDNTNTRHVSIIVVILAVIYTLLGNLK
jgi:hypothetical protein